MDSQEFPVNQCVFGYIFDLMNNLSFFLFDLIIVRLSVEHLIWIVAPAGMWLMLLIYDSKFMSIVLYIMYQSHQK